ncbi:MAG: family 10 glycosylhydrolase [Acidobacteria bacterium]|nr:family 10 glycosylhydrolase [Acidobacteriota bacterium]
MVASLSAAGAPPEVRGVWVDRAPLASRESIQSMLDDLKAANFNAVFVDVWSRGYPLWRSAVFEEHTGVPTDPVYGGRDVLAEVVEEAKSRGMAVIPWVEYGFVIGYSGGKAPLVEAHPDWLAKRRDGSSDFSWAGATKSFWIAHSNPEGQKFLLDLMAELAANYDVPAVQFDRARYPELNCGYDESTKALYAASHDGEPPPDDEKDPEWMRWRAGEINRFVARLNRRLKDVNWRLLVTNAPIVYNYSYVNFLQDYPAWMKASSLDFVSPQVYRADPAAFARELDNQIQALGGDAARLAPGIDVTNSSAGALIQSIQICRERAAAGFVVWYYGGLLQKQALDRLKETVLAEPALLPWK